MSPHRPPQEQRWIRSPSGLILLAFLAIAAFFLIMEHRAHVVGVFPYVLLLLCPVLHLLMHGWHSATGMRTTRRASRGGHKERCDAY